MLAAVLLLAPPSFVGQATPAAASELGERVRSRLQGFSEPGRVPGVSAGIAGPSGCIALAAGLRERGKEKPLAADDLLCAGSTGKTFVAAVVLQLVQEGKLELGAFAGEYLGEADWFERLPNAAELTVENLLRSDLRRRRRAAARPGREARARRLRRRVPGRGGLVRAPAQRRRAHRGEPPLAPQRPAALRVRAGVRARP